MYQHAWSISIGNVKSGSSYLGNGFDLTNIKIVGSLILCFITLSYYMHFMFIYMYVYIYTL